MVYRVYECGSLDTENATSSVDTSAAGINVILADGSENSFTGSHVAKIYQEGTTDKLHKYDGAFYSKMTMNIDGEAQGTGILNIDGDNEGLGTELHLTIHGGYINILSQNDGINTNEDNLSVITINGGTIQIDAGLGEEGDGIDSNGYLVINGGNVYTTACEQGTDGGLDTTLDIQLNGGFLVALGNQHDAVSPDSQQEYLVLSFASALPCGSQVELTDPDGTSLLAFTTEKSGQSLIFSCPNLNQNTDYTLTIDGITQQYTSSQREGADGGGSEPPGRGEARLEIPSSLENWLESTQDIPEEIRIWLEELLEQQTQLPVPSDENPSAEGQRPTNPPGQQNMEGTTTEPSTHFTIIEEIHHFSGITNAGES